MPSTRSVGARPLRVVGTLLTTRASGRPSACSTRQAGHFRGSARPDRANRANPLPLASRGPVTLAAPSLPPNHDPAHPAPVHTSSCRSRRGRRRRHRRPRSPGAVGRGRAARGRSPAPGGRGARLRRRPSTASSQREVALELCERARGLPRRVVRGRRGRHCGAEPRHRHRPRGRLGLPPPDHAAHRGPPLGRAARALRSGHRRHHGRRRGAPSSTARPRRSPRISAGAPTAPSSTWRRWPSSRRATGRSPTSLERLLEREGRLRELVRSLAVAPRRPRSRGGAGAARADRRVPARPAGQPGRGARRGVPPARGRRRHRPPRWRSWSGSSPSPTRRRTVRARALGELRRHYAASGKTGEIIRVLGVALRGRRARGPGRAAPRDRRAPGGRGARGRGARSLRRAPGARPESRGRERAAPRRSATSAGRLDRYADALARAADAGGGDGRGPRGGAHGGAPLRGRAACAPTRSATPPARPPSTRASSAPPPSTTPPCWRSAAASTGSSPASERRAERLDVLERRAALEPHAAQQAPAPRRGGAARRRARRSRSRARARGSWCSPTTRPIARRTRRPSPCSSASSAGSRSSPPWCDPPTRPAPATPRASTACAPPRVHAERLGAPDAAVAAWREIEELFGQSEETIDALVVAARRRGPLGGAGRGAGARAGADARRRCRRQSLLQQLGDLYRTSPASPSRALACYRAVLAEQPAHAGARAGLGELLADPQCRADAAGAAPPSVRGDRRLGGPALAPRAPAGGGRRAPPARTALLLEAADLHEERAGDPAAALARGGPRAPALARRHGDRGAPGPPRRGHAALGRRRRRPRRAVAAGPPRARAAELHYQRGAVLEERLDDAGGRARGVPRGARSLAEDRARRRRRRRARRDARRASGTWPRARVVASARARGASDPGILALLADAADPARGTRPRPRSRAPPSTTHAALPGRARARSSCAPWPCWHRDRRAATRPPPRRCCSACSRAAGGSIETLEMLAGVQRRAPGRPLVDTLLALADAGQHALASLHEAARGGGRRARRRGRSRGPSWSGSSPRSRRASRDGEIRAPGELASFAVRKLVRLAEAEGDHDRAVHHPRRRGGAPARRRGRARAPPRGRRHRRGAARRRRSRRRPLPPRARRQPRRRARHRPALGHLRGERSHRRICSRSAATSSAWPTDDLGQDRAAALHRRAARPRRRGRGAPRCPARQPRRRARPRPLARRAGRPARSGRAPRRARHPARGAGRAARRRAATPPRAADLWTRASEIAEARLRDTGARARGSPPRRRRPPHGGDVRRARPPLHRARRPRGGGGLAGEAPRRARPPDASADAHRHRRAARRGPRRRRPHRRGARLPGARARRSAEATRRRGAARAAARALPRGRRLGRAGPPPHQPRRGPAPRGRAARGGRRLPQEAGLARARHPHPGGDGGAGARPIARRAWRSPPRCAAPASSTGPAPSSPGCSKSTAAAGRRSAPRSTSSSPRSPPPRARAPRPRPSSRPRPR